MRWALVLAMSLSAFAIGWEIGAGLSRGIGFTIAGGLAVLLRVTRGS